MKNNYFTSINCTSLKVDLKPSHLQLLHLCQQSSLEIRLGERSAENKEKMFCHSHSTFSSVLFCWRIFSSTLGSVKVSALSELRGFSLETEPLGLLDTSLHLISFRVPAHTQVLPSTYFHRKTRKIIKIATRFPFQKPSLQYW